MASSDDQIPPGKPTTVGTRVLDAGAAILQLWKPVKQISQHVCTFAIYGEDMRQQIETHHCVHRLNDEFLQCAVYDSDDSDAHLIDLPQEEQKLWHSHAYEVKSGSWVYPQLPEMVVLPELKNIAKTYGKFWCTWQVDRGDRLPLGAPVLMMSPQAIDPGVIRPELVKSRDDKCNMSTDALKHGRAEIAEPEWINPMADYWKQHGKCFMLDVVPTDMKRTVRFP